MASQKAGRQFKGHEDDVKSVAFSPDGKRLEPFEGVSDPLVGGYAASGDDPTLLAIVSMGRLPAPDGKIDY